MGIKERWIASIILVLTIVGLIFAWEHVKPVHYKTSQIHESIYFRDIFGESPEKILGKKYDTIEEAVNAYSSAKAKEESIHSYKTYYKATDKFKKNQRIPGVFTYYEADNDPKTSNLRLTPFYINIKDNKYFVTSYAIVSSYKSFKETPELQSFSQPIKNMYYEFIGAKNKKDLPKSDVVIFIEDEKFYLAISSYNTNEIYNDKSE